MKFKQEVILSITLTHDSGAAVFIDGKLIAAIAEERLNRIKLTRNFPERSIQKVIALSGIVEADINKVIVASYICPNWVSLQFPSFHEVESTNVFSPLLYLVVREQVFARKTGLMKFEGGMIKSIIKKKLDKLYIHAPIEMQEHHMSHCYSAYGSAPFDNSLIVSIDGMGDGLSCLTAVGDKGIVQRVHEMNGFCSPGFIYSQVTQLLGFMPGRHEGKITGLAAYGDYRKCEPLFRQIFHLKKDKFKVKNISSKNHPLYKEIMKHKEEDIAAGLQHVFESVIVNYIRNQMQMSGRNKVALAGGVFANVKLNQRIHEIDGIEELFIFPNMGDGGLPVGAGFAYYQTNPAGIESIYLGDEFSDQQIEKTIRENGLECMHENDIERRIAAFLAEGKIVARFSGKMEYGPRALGNRSILYKTTDKSVNIWLNKKLKRTEFMPFAPSTLMEHAEKYYVGIKGAEATAKYMTITFKCTEESRIDQPACVHVDNTARPQLVDWKDNPSYYRIIDEYNKMTGIPSILNTSFNVHEEPIVNSPDDAIKSFLQCELDVLAIGNFVVMNNNNNNN